MLGKPLIIIALIFMTCGLCTRFHVNSGCILLDGQALCAKGSRKVINRVKVEAKFSGNRDRKRDVVGCLKNFDWPAAYGDVYFGADSCLYDSKGANINAQCCHNRGGYEADNPYRS